MSKEIDNVDSSSSDSEMEQNDSQLKSGFKDEDIPVRNVEF